MGNFIQDLEDSWAGMNPWNSHQWREPNHNVLYNQDSNASTLANGNYHWPNLSNIPDWNSLSETLIKNDETREACNNQEKITVTALDVTANTVCWQDIANQLTTQNVMSSSWPPGDIQQHRWDKINNFTNGVGKLS